MIASTPFALVDMRGFGHDGWYYRDHSGKVRQLPGAWRNQLQEKNALIHGLLFKVYGGIVCRV